MTVNDYHAMSDGRERIEVLDSIGTFHEKTLYFTQNGKNLVDRAGNILPLSDEYLIDSILCEGRYVVNGEKGKGVIDEKGNLLTECFYERIILISDKKHFICFRKNTANWAGEDEEFRQTFNLNGDKVLLYKEKEYILTAEYDSFENFMNNGLAPVMKNGKWGFIDTNMKEVIECQFLKYQWLDDKYCVVVGGYYGWERYKALVNTSGEFVLSPGQYKDISAFKDGYSIITMYPFYHTEQCRDYGEKVYEERKINEDGCLIVISEGERKILNKEYKWYIDNSDGTLSVYDGKHWGLLDKDLKVLVNCIYPKRFVYNGSYAVVRNESGAGLIDQSQRLIIKHEYDLIECYPSVGIVYGWKGTNVVIYNIKGEKLTELDCDAVYPLSENYTKFRRFKNRECKSDGFLAGFINHTTGKESFGFDDVGIEGDGLISIMKRFSLVSKWGFANYDGDVIIPYGYILADRFRNGQALVTDKRDNIGFQSNRRHSFYVATEKDRYRWGTIGMDGTIRVPLIYRNLLFVKGTNSQLLYGSYDGINTYLNAKGEPVSFLKDGRKISFPGYFACDATPVNGRILVYGDSGVCVADTQARIIVKCREYGDTIIGPKLLSNGNMEVQLKRNDNKVESMTMNENGCLITDKNGKSVVLPFKYIFAANWQGNYIPVMSGNLWGVLNDSFKEVVPCSYQNLFLINDKAIAQSDNCFIIIDLISLETIEIDSDYIQQLTSGWLLVRKDYPTNSSFSSREKVVHKYGIICLNGQVVLRTEYDAIDLENPAPKTDRKGEEVVYMDRHYGYDDNIPSYGKYAGTYAQDVAGLSDEVIDDALDGEPEAYWNID